MIVQALSFYLFASVAVAAAVMVISARNPVHSVLFLILDISFTELREGFLQYLPIGGLVGLVLLAELLMIGGTWLGGPELAGARGFPTPPIDQIPNTDAIGRILYTDYIYLFQASGLVLLVAMIGAIVLTLRARPGVRKQRIGDQLARRREDTIELKKIQPGSGV